MCFSLYFENGIAARDKIKVDFVYTNYNDDGIKRENEYSSALTLTADWNFDLTAANILKIKISEEGCKISVNNQSFSDKAENVSLEKDYVGYHGISACVNKILKYYPEENGTISSNNGWKITRKNKAHGLLVYGRRVLYGS